MAEQKKPTVVIENCDFSDNGRDGMHFAGEAEAKITSTRAERNQRDGFHQSKARTEAKAWYERPIGIVALAVIAAVITYFLGVA